MFNNISFPIQNSLAKRIGVPRSKVFFERSKFIYSLHKKLLQRCTIPFFVWIHWNFSISFTKMVSQYIFFQPANKTNYKLQYQHLNTVFFKFISNSWRIWHVQLQTRPSNKFSRSIKSFLRCTNPILFSIHFNFSILCFRRMVSQHIFRHLPEALLIKYFCIV